MKKITSEDIKTDIKQLLKLDNNLSKINKDNVYKIFKRFVIKKNILQLNYNKIKNNFTKFVPESFIDSVSKGILEDIKIGVNKEKEMHIMFIDISGFTNISEKLTPKKSLKLLNWYFKGIVKISRKNGGYIDKFLGDGIMLVFNQVNSDNTLKTAYDIIKLVSEKNKNNFKSKLNIGIGINSGKAILGTIGSKCRMNITVVGDAVNIASRIEKQTRLEKNWILFSKSTYNLLENKNKFNIEEIGEKKLKGKTEKIFLYGIK